MLLQHISWSNLLCYHCLKFQTNSTLSITDSHTEDEIGLGNILAFATGLENVPPHGFTPIPTISFLHPGDNGPLEYPQAYTCSNELCLPIHQRQSCFSSRMTDGILMSPGFGKMWTWESGRGRHSDWALTMPIITATHVKPFIWLLVPQWWQSRTQRRNPLIHIGRHCISVRLRCCSVHHCRRICRRGK